MDHNTTPNVELAAFLRSRRESLDPKRLGLPQVGRRRTPGLRREEVAQLADVSATWYTWLEQGRAVKASSKALEAITTALQCTVAEKRHVFRLAGQPEPVEAKVPCQQVSLANQILLDQLDPLPALMVNARLDIVGFNRAYCDLTRVELGDIAPADRNCIYLSLTNANWRQSIVSKEQVLPKLVAFFRANMAGAPDTPIWQQYLAKFRAASEEFEQLWQRQDVDCVTNLQKRYYHPAVGEMELQQSNWWSAPRNGDRLLVCVPVNEQSRAALARVTVRP
ncbi:helix-turn-helix transcriptional regulator [Gallaecimonas xiamenensis]|uniref:Helix-turn-helix domain-containing protein n=1 Tax=Gallaecimonas xiamenensis 3-C-1 TaxID=745411 RepID=K2JKL5_9GAMM|nr:helix-turn-helix transcriptional regulator [Gallaecimonas xiamenensis]EKE74992.1 helix-turn-helix domain-containing protein [Gallaecimonas xiamenensis 3-C-1]